MPRRISLKDLIPPPDQRDTVEMPDGKVYVLPILGVKEMSQLLTVEEETEGSDTFSDLVVQNDRLIEMLREANPGEAIKDYDLPPDALMELISAFTGGPSVAAEVRAALSNEQDVAETGGEATDETATGAAQELAEAAGTAEEGGEPPLVSARRSRPRSSRSAPTGTGGRNGGTESAGASLSPTSEKSSANKPA